MSDCEFTCLEGPVTRTSSTTTVYRMLNANDIAHALTSLMDIDDLIACMIINTFYMKQHLPMALAMDIMDSDMIRQCKSVKCGDLNSASICIEGLHGEQHHTVTLQVTHQSVEESIKPIAIYLTE